MPVGTSWRRLECFDQAHPNAAGQVGWGMDAKLQQRIEEADVVIALGTRLGEETTLGYTLVKSPVPRQKLVHIYPDSDELGRVFAPVLSIVAGVKGFAQALSELDVVAASEDRKTLVGNAHEEYLATLKPLPAPGPLSLDVIAAAVNEKLGPDACVTVGAGNYALYPHRYRQFRQMGTSLAPTVGSMGYGLPAAISAKLQNREQTVVCYAGDGCFQMTMQELGVALQYKLGIVILVFNNGVWGTIRAHQERDFPGRAIALDFVNPDFTQVIKGYGGYGEVVERTDDFADAFDRALAYADEHQLPALLEIRYDPNGIAPGETLSQIRERSLAAAN